MGKLEAILKPNRTLALEHLGLLFGRAMTGRIELTAIRAGEDRAAPRTKFFDVDELEDAADWACDTNSDHMWNVYVGAALRSPDVFPGKAATDEDFHKAYAIHADVDDGHDLGAVRAKYRSLGITPPFIVVTGRTPSTRAQLWWPLDEAISDPDVYRQTLRGVAAALHTDPAVTAAKQLMRLAGTVNWPKKGGRLLEPTEVNRPTSAARGFPIEQIHRAFPPTAESITRGALPEVVVEPAGSLGLDERITDGREGYAFRLVRAHLIECIGTTGCVPSVDELYASAAPVYLKKVDQTRPGRGPTFLREKCVSALRAFASGQIPFARTLDEAVSAYATRQQEWTPGEPEGDEAPNASPASPGDDELFEVLTISDLRALPDAEWMVKDAIPKQALGFIYGPPGSYKSFICCDLGLTLAYGMEAWIDRPVKNQGSVLYIANEGAAGLKNRITAWQMARGISEDTDRFRLIRKAMSFMDAQDVARLQRTVAAEVEANGPVETIFVDTVSRVLPGADENLQKDMTIFVQACDRLREAFGCTVIGVHHTNKNGEMRGSTVFLGQGDFIFRVDKSDGAKAGVFACEKQKEAEDGWKLAFEMKEHSWTPVGRLEAVGSLAVEFTGAAAGEVESEHAWPSKDVCRAVLREIDAAWRKGKPWSPHARAQGEGRFAVRNISQAFQIKPKVAQMMLEAWQQNDVLSFDMLDAKTKARGLKVVSWPF